MPSGILSETAQCVVGNGVVIHLPTLFEEIATLQEQGVSTERLIISERAHLLFDLHKASAWPCWSTCEMCMGGGLPCWAVCICPAGLQALPAKAQSSERESATGWLVWGTQYVVLILCRRLMGSGKRSWLERR